MVRAEIEEKIARLSRQLENYEWKKNSAMNERKRMENASEELSRKAREIEERLNEIMESVDRELSKVNPRSRFPDIYREGVKKRLVNSNSDNAIAETKAGSQRAKKKCIELDELVSEYDALISETRAEIEALKIELSKAVV